MTKLSVSIRHDRPRSDLKSGIISILGHFLEIFVTPKIGQNFVKISKISELEHVLSFFEQKIIPIFRHS